MSPVDVATAQGAGPCWPRTAENPCFYHLHPIDVDVEAPLLEEPWGCQTAHSSRISTARGAQGLLQGVLTCEVGCATCNRREPGEHCKCRGSSIRCDGERGTGAFHRNAVVARQRDDRGGEGGAPACSRGCDCVGATAHTGREPRGGEPDCCGSNVTCDTPYGFRVAVEGFVRPARCDVVAWSREYHAMIVRAHHQAIMQICA